jgi:hypothetical protein
MDTSDDASRGRRDRSDIPTQQNARDASDPEETYNPWTIVNLVFRHLAMEGLHPVLGESGDPGEPAAGLLRALGISPLVEGNRQVAARVNDELARIRAAFDAEWER